MAVVIGLALASVVSAIGGAVASPDQVLVNRDASWSSELAPQHGPIKLGLDGIVGAPGR
jgi:hypothetical protein